jgi:hypothetical protein
VSLGFYPISELPLTALASGQSVGALTASIYLSTNGYISHSSASVPSTAVLPRVRQALDFSRSLAAGERFGGPVQSVGEIVLENADGYFDGTLTGYAIDGRRVRVKMGGPDFAYDDFGTVFDGTAKEWVYTETEIRLPIRDNLELLNVPIQTTVYTSATGGNAFAGKPQPLLFGKVFNITPPLKDPVGLVYHVNSDGSTIVSTVYDQGVALSAVVSSPAAGQYSVDASAGTFTLGGSPAGIITCTARGVASASTTSDIVQRICENYAGLAQSSLDLGTFQDLSNQSSIGIWIGPEQRSCLDVIGEIMYGVGGWFGFNRAGKLQVGILEAPASAVSQGTFTQTDILAIERVSLPSEVSPPNFQRRVGYQRNYTLQSTDLAGSVSDERRAFLREEYRVAISTDTNIKSTHLLATDPPIVRGLFTEQTDAQDEADRLLTLYKADRSHYRVTIKGRSFGLDLGQTVQIVYPRWDMTDGKYFVIVGMGDDAMNNQAVLELFG